MKLTKWFNNVDRYSSMSFIVTISCGWNSCTPKLFVDSSNKRWKLFIFLINDFNPLLKESNLNKLQILDKNATIYKFTKDKNTSVKTNMVPTLNTTLNPFSFRNICSTSLTEVTSNQIMVSWINASTSKEIFYETF